MVKVTVALVLILAAFVPCYAATANVTVEDYNFSPNYVTIDLNDTVLWTWDNFNSIEWGIASDENPYEMWDSLEQYTGTYEHTFTHAGTFTYYGTWFGGFFVSEDMVGTVEVLDTPSVPEPGSLIVLGSLASGLVGTVLRRRNRK